MLTNAASFGTKKVRLQNIRQMAREQLIEWDELLCEIDEKKYNLLLRSFR
jgi:hypothetical protein